MPEAFSEGHKLAVPLWQRWKACGFSMGKVLDLFANPRYRSLCKPKTSIY